MAGRVAFVLFVILLPTGQSSPSTTISSTVLHTSELSTKIESMDMYPSTDAIEINDYDYDGTVTTDTSPESTRWSWTAMTWSWYTVLQLLSVILGMVGNLLVIVVIFGRRSSTRQLSSTDILVGNLAIADFLTSVFLIPYPPPDLVPMTWAGWIYCKLFFANFFMWTFITASIYFLVALSFDRFFAVLYPIHFKHHFSFKRVIMAVLSIWCISPLISSMGFFTNSVDGKSGTCAIKFASSEAKLLLGFFTFSVRLVIPTCSMLVTQIAVIRALHREAAIFKSTNQQLANSKPSFHIIARDRTIKLVFTIVVTYIVCWAPDQVVFLLFNLGIIPLSYFFTPIHRILFIVAFFNSCANPIIYTLRHPQFRKAVKSFFLGGQARKSPIFDEVISRREPTSQHEIVA
ncbi:allatostatin-A receptor-like [Diadema antillarum]|uniref:allatostatin-A receptor-like n=1 Tax=Diadema antillarum TaxID=105358 RepID=UPI003A84FB9A